MLNSIQPLWLSNLPRLQSWLALRMLVKTTMLSYIIFVVMYNIICCPPFFVCAQCAMAAVWCARALSVMDQPS